jgi:hypothetical protein
VELKLPDVPRRLLSDALNVLKAEHAARQTERLNANRVHIKVLATGVLMTQDSTLVGYYKKCSNRSRVFR